MQNPDVAPNAKPPRVLAVRFPYGAPLGEPGNVEAQKHVLTEALDLFRTARGPGAVVQSPELWKR